MWQVKQKEKKPKPTNKPNRADNRQPITKKLNDCLRDDQPTARQIDCSANHMTHVVVQYGKMQYKAAVVATTTAT